MHAKSRSVTLKQILGVRVTDEERTVFQLRAEEAGLSLSEWSRRALLASVSTSPETRLLLAELLAFRKLALWLQAQTIKGVLLDEAAFKQAVEQAEITKLLWADERIERYFAAEVKEPAA